MTGSKVSAVQRGRQGDVKPQMEKQLQKFGCFSVALEIREPEELTVEMVIERVSKAAIVEKEVLEGDSAGRNAFTVEAFREALAEERKMAERTIGRSKALQIARTPGPNWNQPTSCGRSDLSLLPPLTCTGVIPTAITTTTTMTTSTKTQLYAVSSYTGISINLLP